MTQSISDLSITDAAAAIKLQLDSGEFKQRRDKLAALLKPNSVALLSGAKATLRNGDVEYAFRQNSNFLYFTGLMEPDAMMLLTVDSNRQVEYILFTAPHDPVLSIWNGEMIGQQGALQQYQADVAYPNSEFWQQLTRYLADAENLYYVFAESLALDRQLVESLHHLRTTVRSKTRGYPDTLIDLAPMIAELRLCKSDIELSLMEKAIATSVVAHNLLLRECNIGMYEYELAGIFMGTCMRAGCDGMAYQPIVAGGNHGCTLHYTRNNGVLHAGDLVLVDAGAEFAGYAADITTVFPVSGKFSAEQKAIYELVLASQHAGLQQIKPGNSWHMIQEAIVQVITEGLLSLGLLRGKVKDLLAEQAYRKYYMHSSGHWLGLDVHDVGSYRAGLRSEKWCSLVPRMVLTVEPGIYIAPGDVDIDKKWWGIAVRIEDDVLVTESGYMVLSHGIPRTVAEIESAMF